MSRYISNAWFRAIHEQTSHHIALLDQPPKHKPSNYKENLPLFKEENEITTYYSLLRFLLYKFQEVWKTPPSAKSEQQISPGQFQSERKTLTSLWALVECIDALEDEEDIEPSFTYLGTDETQLAHLWEFWTRDADDIYAHEKRDPFTPVWAFVAGQRFPDPGIECLLATIETAIRENKCILGAKKTERGPFVISEGHVATASVRGPSDDPFEPIDIMVRGMKLEVDEAVKPVKELYELGLCSTPPSSPVSDTVYRMCDSVKGEYRVFMLLAL